jgi:hypothetical protein
MRHRSTSRNVTLQEDLGVLDPGGPAHTVVIGCGALGRELVSLAAGLPGVDVGCLPARLHNRPERIAGAVRERLDRIRAEHGDGVRVFVAYADCGTGGALDAALAGTGVERLPGAHCYEVYAGPDAFAAMADEEPGTFYLTDFLARQFDTLVWAGLGLDRHPGLLPQLFGNYRRLVYLAQTEDPELDRRARSAAERLGLAYERRLVGLGDLRSAIEVLGPAGVAS